MFYVKIADGVVANRAVFDAPMPDDWPDRDTWVASETAQIGWAYDGNTFTPPDVPAPDESPLEAPVKLVALGHFILDAGEITGLDTSSNIAGGFKADTGTYWVFFANPLPDTDYAALVYDGAIGLRMCVKVADKATDYFVVSVFDANGDPIDADDFTVEIKRAG